MGAEHDENACFCFLVRHGATANNLADPPILQGNSVDLPLSPEGVAQAAAAADCLGAQTLRAVFASPLRRAQETAQEIAAPHNLEVQSVPEIVEVDVGEWEGKSWVDIAQQDTDAYERFQADPAQHGYRGGESLSDVASRAFPALASVMEQHRGHQVVVVAHNVVNRVVLADALGLPLSKARRLAQENCGINLLRWRANDGFKVLMFNGVLHLDGYR